MEEQEAACVDLNWGKASLREQPFPQSFSNGFDGMIMMDEEGMGVIHADKQNKLYSFTESILQ